VSFATIILCVASQRVLVVVVSLLTQSGKFWIHSYVTEESTVIPNYCRDSRGL
jgi:hypothetical protein